MISKLIGESHEQWPELLGPVAIAYNVTIHTETGHSPHELFYSFQTSCPLDVLVDTPATEPVSNADAYAPGTENRLRNSFTFVCQYTGRQAERMKERYDAAVKPNNYRTGDFVLLYLSLIHI